MLLQVRIWPHTIGCRRSTERGGRGAGARGVMQKSFARSRVGAVYRCGVFLGSLFIQLERAPGAHSRVFLLRAVVVQSLDIISTARCCSGIARAACCLR